MVKDMKCDMDEGEGLGESEAKGKDKGVVWQVKYIIVTMCMLCVV